MMYMHGFDDCTRQYQCSGSVNGVTYTDLELQIYTTKVLYSLTV
jgi:hypothetical protein